jgi:hypothetical protein
VKFEHVVFIAKYITGVENGASMSMDKENKGIKKKYPELI